VPGALTPVAMTGKYYFNYENEFLPPRDLGRSNAERLKGELVSDNMGICRFHRGWSEAMVPEIMGQLFQKKDAYLKSVALTAARINSRNSSVFWETERNIDFVHTALKRMQTVDSNKDAELARWVEGFEKDRKETALSFWYEVHKGMDESLREFQ
jgi:glyceraldehyde-3-phosphate dehydrogenase (ferredoxin)